LDAAYATIVTTPIDVIKKLEDALDLAMVQIDPEAARATWGLTPEHQAKAQGLSKLNDVTNG
jgi:hypothetical protein